MDLGEIKQSLNDDRIIEILKDFGVENYVDKPDFIIFPTICHNEEVSEASMKLYYYKENKMFHCYTGCGESFDIFELLEKIYKLRNIKYNFYNDIILKISKNRISPDLGFFGEVKYKSELDKYHKKRDGQLPIYNNKILDVFSKYYTIEWLLEGISKESMDKYNILYSISQNKIIIPHYDINGNLVGVRGRALNEWEIDGAKYMPVKVEDVLYKHPLSLNLYGINLAKEDINKYKNVVLFEGENSPEPIFPFHQRGHICG